MGECLLVKFAIPTHPWFFSHFEKEPLRVEKGEVQLTERPGFGIELDPAKVEKETRLEA
jgi:L-alanine-DL-glutamate epimerase-like enolase superfamily enzyme